MHVRAGLILLFCLSGSFFCLAQTQLLTLADADSNFVRKPLRSNEIRFFYGLQGNNVSLGSKRDSHTSFNGDLYTNTNDYIGLGLTYKWLDGDVSFSLPGTTYLNQERSTLTQLRLGASYTLRKFAFRGYYLDNKGVVLSGTEDEFYSTPSLHEARLGLQMTYLFNAAKYSFRAAMYQSEYQVKTAGSFLLRLEPFYRNLGGKSESMIPAAFDLSSRFGEQAGLVYIKAPGVLMMPGYGINIVIPNSRLSISPVVFAGLGTAFNVYNANDIKYKYVNVEYAASFNLNMGYSGSRYYSKLQFNWTAGYVPLDPSYLTSNNLTISLWVGVRFSDLKKF